MLNDISTCRWQLYALIVLKEETQKYQKPVHSIQVFLAVLIMLKENVLVQQELTSDVKKLGKERKYSSCYCNSMLPLK